MGCLFLVVQFRPKIDRHSYRITRWKKDERMETHLVQGLNLLGITPQHELKVKLVVLTDPGLGHEVPGTPHRVQGHVRLKLQPGLSVKVVAEGRCGGGRGRDEQQRLEEQPHLR